MHKIERRLNEQSAHKIIIKYTRLQYTMQSSKSIIVTHSPMREAAKNMPRPLQVYLCPILVLLACLFSRLRNDLYCVEWDVKP